MDIEFDSKYRRDDKNEKKDGIDELKGKKII